MDVKTWMVAAILGLGAAHATAAPPKPKALQVRPHDVAGLVQWVGRTGDAPGKPIAIVDKKNARLHVFDAQHRLVASTSVLLGQTLGDHTVAGVGQRAQIGRVGLNERTTPAGRFDTMPGRNLQGEHVVWLDYEAAFAIHRLRPAYNLADRQARLDSSTPADNRASLGCVVVPVSFYLRTMEPIFGKAPGVVYVMPEASAPTT